MSTGKKAVVFKPQRRKVKPTQRVSHVFPLCQRLFFLISSLADIDITLVQEALQMVEVRLLEHVVDSAEECVSMTEQGFII